MNNILLSAIFVVLCFLTGILSGYQTWLTKNQIHIWDKIICMSSNWDLFTGIVDDAVGENLTFWKRVAKKYECEKM